MLAGGGLLVGRNWGLPLIVIGLGLALTGLTIGVHAHGWVTALDGPVTNWINHRAQRSHRLRPAGAAVAEFGGPAAVAMAAAISGALLSARYRSLIPGVVVVVTTATAVLAKNVIKIIIERPVTGAEIAASPALSSDPHPFPSGHVAGTAALLGIVAVGIGLRGGRVMRGVLTSLVVAGTSIVAVSRLILQVHWLTDIAGGLLLAGIAVTLGTGVLLSTTRVAPRGGGRRAVHRGAAQKRRLRARLTT